MDTKALRQKILDLAIRGKLVPQDPNDEPAEVLLERIREQKQQMLKEGKLKKRDIKNDTIIFKGEDNLHYEKFQDGTVKCIEDEIPFEVPEGWEWCRFGSVVTLMSGTTYPAEKELLSGTRLYVKVGDMNLPGNKYEISTSSRYLDEYNISHLVPVNSVIFPKRGGAISTNKKKLVLRDEILIDLNTMAFTPISPVNLMYCYYWFLSIDLGKINSGSSVPQINNKDIEPLLFPVPPTFEQERIVQAIVPLLDAGQKISAAGVEVAQIISRAKSKILDLAIRGKLVPQDPNDEPASVLLERIRAEKEELIKQGKIKRNKKKSVIFKGDDNSYYEKIDGEVSCIDVEIPYDIPDTWTWMRLENCCVKEIRRGKSPKYAEISNVIVFAQKCNTKYNGIDISLAQYLDETTLKRYPTDEYMQDGDVVINSTGTGTLGRVGIYRDGDNTTGLSIVPDSHVTIIRGFSCICPYYLYAYIKAHQSELEKKGEGSTNQKELKPLTLKEMLIAIPPLSEQKRIDKMIDVAFQSLAVIEENLN